MKLGKVSDSVLKRSVLKQIHTRREEVKDGAGIGADCAIFALSDTEEYIACCVREAAVAVQADMENVNAQNLQQSLETTVTMEQLLQKGANNLAAGGAEPIAAMITLLLPGETEEPWIRQLMAEAEAACEKLSMQIAGGQTRMTKAVQMPYAVIACYGKLCREWYGTRKKVCPGQDIVISKWIGLEGTARLADKNREQLLAHYPAYLVEEAAGFDKYLSIIHEAATAMKSGVCAMHDVSEGGIFAALWELAEAAGVGLTIDMKKIPLRQETVEVCELLNVNPYELLSGGCLIMTTQDGTGLVAALEAEQIPAVIVGKITDSNDRLILNEDEVRYMDRPKQDEIYRLIEENRI